MTNSQFILLVLWCAGELVVSAARSHPLPALALRLHRTARAPGQTRRRSMSSAGSPELAPAFTGYGTHYVYLYVGTPAQRQSVIIDTGSHFTAFPCTGCSNCGSHTDPYYDLDKSNTESIPLCGGSKCLFSQSYAEGSSWHAYKVVDKIWVGGSSADEVANGDLYQVDYTFGCQTSEAGLFKTQLENGIMGMSMSPDSFANQLNRAGITQSTVFGLCFSFNGGIITLGGVDPAVHRDHSATVQYAKLYPRNSWYGVKVLDMRLLRRDGTEQTFSKKNTVATAFTGSSMGTIVDSGTTDTYLPSALLGEFSAAFKAITGIAFRANTQISLTTEQMNIFPDILLELEGASGSPVVVRMPWQNYVEKDAGSNKYEFILFFEESHGAILGANFMDGYNIIFDDVGGRVGFAESDCDFSELAPQGVKVPQSPLPTTWPTPEPFMPPEWAPSGPCDAMCDVEDSPVPYSQLGAQTWVNKNDGVTTVDRTCTIHCAEDHSIYFSSFADLNCSSKVDDVWSICSEACQQSKPSWALTDKGLCGKEQVATRDCYAEGCPILAGDYAVSIQFLFHYPMPRWSMMIGDDLVEAISDVLKLPVANVVLRVNESGVTSVEGFHIEMRARERAAGGDIFAAEGILRSASTENPDWLPLQILHALDKISIRSRDVDYSVYGWMRPQDLKVISVNSYIVHDSSISKTPDRSEWIFNIEVSVGITLSLVALLCIYLCCRGRSVPEASQALYIKVDTSEQDVELTGLRAGRGVDLSDARLDESDLNSGRV